MRLIRLLLPTALLVFSFQAKSQDPAQRVTLERKTKIYIGIEPCNNGEVTTFEKHKGCGTKPIGYTIDDASAAPAKNFVEVFAGDDVGNNKIVSKDSNFQNGSMESIGYLSKNPIRRGTRIYSGNEPCNNGFASTSTRTKGCGTEFLGYALPPD